MFVEYQGEPEIAEFCDANDYVIFDTEYNCIPINVSVDDLNFKPGYKQMNLSLGAKAVRGAFPNLPREASALTDWMAEYREKNGHIWTDLVLVRKEFEDDFLVAANAVGFLTSHQY